MTDPAALWVYLAHSPLLWLTVTLVAWSFAEWMSAATNRHTLVNPVLISVVFVGLVLTATGTPYPVYFEGAQFVHFLLGPAIVAIGMPLARQMPVVRANLFPMLAALLAGSTTAILSAVWLGRALGLPYPVLMSLAPKSVTAGIAMGISQQIGGDSTLTAAICLITGLSGAIMITPLMNRLGVTNYAARGLAAGLAAHGIGTSRAFAVSPLAGIFSGIAMGLNGVLTPLLLPLLSGWF